MFGAWAGNCLPVDEDAWRETTLPSHSPPLIFSFFCIPRPQSSLREVSAERDALLDDQGDTEAVKERLAAAIAEQHRLELALADAETRVMAAGA